MVGENKSTIKILVVRNDKLGDFMLAYPSFALLKQALPQSRIYALVPAYTQEMAASCRWIDDIIVDPGAGAAAREQRQLLSTLRSQNFSASITLFSTTRIGLLLFLARIPRRVAPATKIAQLFYNLRLAQRRSRSEKPEYQYNTDLVVFYLTRSGADIPPMPTPPWLSFDSERIGQLRTTFCLEYDIAPSSRLVFLHTGSGGSANTLSAQQFAELARHLNFTKNDFTPLHFVLTAGPNELAHAQTVSALLGDLPNTIYHSTDGLRVFAEHIAFADIFISGSTGPLHIAGALDIPTAAFYTRRRSATPLRWQTLNSPDKRLAFTPPQDTDECDMDGIDVAHAAAEINRKFFNLE
ncbi:MAG: glycosyltransferase family 9 protein [Gammaproteobacteria bacterium]|jgi:ADP-heptose:LPS heptosyltransferase